MYLFIHDVLTPYKIAKGKMPIDPNLTISIDDLSSNDGICEHCQTNC